MRDGNGNIATWQLLSGNGTDMFARLKWHDNKMAVTIREMEMACLQDGNGMIARWQPLSGNRNDMFARW